MEEIKMCLEGYGICVNCNECDRCDIDNGKLCDSCGKCLETDKEYLVIKIDKIDLEGI